MSELARAIPEWMEVLSAIERSLEASLAVVVDLPADQPAEQGSRVAALERLEERLTRWQASLEEATASSRASDELIVAAAQTLVDWSKTAQALRESVAGKMQQVKA